MRSLTTFLLIHLESKYGELETPPVSARYIGSEARKNYRRYGIFKRSSSSAAAATTLSPSSELNISNALQQSFSLKGYWIR